ncbi:MAG: bifunctional adenosylcobinamide kinase/adenosylcobinamide-phosphate guanylyltransferase [Parasporobacterium sp.]|nr:bifunctional adenosylcobinamide kinase/adenosylcobinamide-phosphate guanylyltransferase [Parasporobacterium sp.]
MFILFTGGSACGKSSYAEQTCQTIGGTLYYLATMQPYGPEGEMRITRHRALREGKGFITIEKYTDIHEIQLPERGTLLLECICNLTANEMFDENFNLQDPVDKIIEGIKVLASQCDNLIVVTNDVGSDIQDYSDETRAYIRALGTVNAKLAAEADSVIEMVCGIPVVLK